MRVNAEKKRKEPISEIAVYRIMITVTFVVAGVFLIKDLLVKDIAGAKVICLILGGLLAMLVALRVFRVKQDIRSFLVSVALVVVVFVISLNSGEYYSDDYALYLAAFALSGHFLKPRITIVQIVLADILLYFQYRIHPEKADVLSQFIMCVVTFTLAGVMIFLVIHRGYAFICLGQNRAEEAENLLGSMRTMGKDLRVSVEASADKMNMLREANATMVKSTSELMNGSVTIVNEAQEVAVCCENVQQRLQVTENQIDALNTTVKSFESTLTSNQTYLEEVSKRMEEVKSVIFETEEVFELLNEQMRKINASTEQIHKISSNTGLLAVNASVEAKRAGKAGAGFSVVASNIRQLAVNSSECSDEVTDAVFAMQKQIDRTSSLLSDSMRSVEGSLSKLTALHESFDALTDQFGTLYGDISEQNENIEDVNAIFETLKTKVGVMSAGSEDNHASVQEIAGTMNVYRDNVETVVQGTQQIFELSENMLLISGGNEAVQ